MRSSSNALVGAEVVHRHPRRRVAACVGGLGFQAGVLRRTGYAFDSGFAIDLGWRHAEEDEETSQTIGVLVVYEAEF